MYRLSQWAGDFPTLWEPHGSFTPLFTSQPKELAFFQICVTDFAYISILSYLSVLCSLFSFSFFSPPFFLHLSSEPWHKQRAPPFSAGPLAALIRRTHRQDLSVRLWITLFYTMIDRVTIQTDIRRSRSGAEEKSPPDNTCRFLLLPMLSERHPVSPFHN